MCGVYADYVYVCLYPLYAFPLVYTYTPIRIGCGFYHVTPDLSLITKQRMMDGGIGIDFISLTTPPIHHVPLFHVHGHNYDDIRDFYDFPYWINVCYVDCPKDSRYNVHRMCIYIVCRCI